MALVEGSGEFTCRTHDFKTRDLQKFNEHCNDGNHTDQGNTVCTVCGKRFEFKDLPYKPQDPLTGFKGIALKCENCESKTQGKLKRSEL
jgi:hypothetical protein